MSGQPRRNKYQILQDIYEQKGATSPEFTKEILPIIKAGLAKHMKPYPEELVNHAYVRLMDRIKPKKDTDGAMRCFYFQRSGKRKEGYDLTRGTNIGSYAMSVCEYAIKDFYYYENKSLKTLVVDNDEDYTKLPCLFRESNAVKLSTLHIDKAATDPVAQKVLCWFNNSEVSA